MPSHDFEFEGYTIGLVDRDDNRQTHTVIVPLNCYTDCLLKVGQRLCLMEFDGTTLLALKGRHVGYSDFCKGSDGGSDDVECYYAPTWSPWDSPEPFFMTVAKGKGLVKEYGVMLLRSGGNDRKIFG